jgi:DNA-binding NarL/FixJ family response regulator
LDAVTTAAQPCARNGRAAVKVLICSPIRLYRDGLAGALGEAVGVEVVGTASGRRDCVARCGPSGAAVVLLDLATPQSLETIRDLVADVGGIKVVALGVPEEEHAVIACAEAGVAGYVTREETLGGLRETLRVVARHGFECPPRLAGFLLARIAGSAHATDAHIDRARLTPREREVLALIAQGLSNKQIARRLYIELPTVKNHVHHILDKLSVEHRADAVAWLHDQRRWERVGSLT